MYMYLYMHFIVFSTYVYVLCTAGVHVCTVYILYIQYMYMTVRVV